MALSFSLKSLLRAPLVLRNPLRVSALALAALTAVSAPAHAQASPGGGGFQHQLVVAPTPFSWSTASGLGLVKVPAPVDYGWIIMPNDKLQFRFVPSLTGDPTIEAIFWPPASGHPTKAERITFQFPINGPKIPGSGALVIAFHSYCVSEKDIYLNTQIAAMCKARGWALVAPYGLVDTHYGNVQSQESLVKVLNVVQKYYQFDPRRVYAMGFSMGGGAALSFSMRHLSESRVQVAAVVNHTGTQDLIDVYQSGTLGVKNMLSDSDHFGTMPTSADNAFPYLRVSPSRVVVGSVDPNLTPLRNMRHVPIYTFLNLNDPQSKLVTHNLAVTNYLQSIGQSVTLVSINGAVEHKWMTMDLDAAFTWLERQSLADKPTTMELFADKEVQYLDTVVRDKQDLRIARYDVTAFQGTNTIDIFNTRYLNTLFVDLGAMRLNPAGVLTVNWNSIDSLGDELVFPGYASAPSAVTFNGLPHATWSFDGGTGEVSISMLPGITSGTLVVTP